MTIASTAPALRLQGVSKAFGTTGQRRWAPWASPSGRPARVVKTAVDNVSLDVRRGEIVGVLGANGSGKSTLIRLVATLLIADSGHISVFGLDIQRDEQAAKRLINRVSVDAAFFKKLSPMENLIYAARLYGLRAGPARAQAFEILERLGISRRSTLNPMEHMSRGMQQKVAIARALLTAPTLLLLDEPTTGLDPRSKKDVQAFVEEVRASHDATVVLTTHDMDEADRLCDRVAVLSQGRIIALDTPTNLKTTVGAKASLEDVFLELTGSALDDEDGEVAA
ncbi:MAG: ABC transporter ATP-binding protein [Chloroflexi bacterium]|nr:ABC transporter ATP-binding protein [Chloroflexota bacterium]